MRNLSILSALCFWAASVASANDIRRNLDAIHVTEISDTGFEAANLTNHKIGIKKVKFTTVNAGELVGFQIAIDHKPVLNGIFHHFMRDEPGEVLVARAKQTPSIITDANRVVFKEIAVMRSHSRFSNIVEATVTLKGESYSVTFDDLDGQLPVHVTNEPYEP